MINADKNKFAVIMAGVGLAYDVEITKEKMSLFFSDLNVYEIGEVESAFDRHRRSSPFAPKIADIVRLIEGSGVDIASLAWTKVSKSASSVGRYSSVCFDDKNIMRVMYDMGGWERFCNMTDKESPFVANEFMTRYRALLTAGGATEYPKVFIGSMDAENMRNGFQKAPSVVLIGEQEKAVKVYEGGGTIRINATKLNDLLPALRKVECLGLINSA